MPPADRPTIADVARAAGVSVATVDRVLNRRAPVRRETARLVLDAAEALGFHASRLLRRQIEAPVPERRLGFLLQHGHESFYRLFGEALTQAARTAPGGPARAQVSFLDDLSARSVAEALLALARRCDAVALVAADHPLVTEAAASVQAAGVPVIALLSDLSAAARCGTVMVDHRKAGRTAAWAIARLARAPGPVGVMIGSHRYLGHELCEISFRSYFREHAPQFRLLDARMTLEEYRLAHELTAELLARTPDLAGLYLAGGGMEGVIAALREYGRYGDLVVVCNELIPETRAALIDGVVDLVLATPIAAVAQEAVRMMLASLDGRTREVGTVQLGAELHVAENIG